MFNELDLLFSPQMNLQFLVVVVLSALLGGSWAQQGKKQTQRPEVYSDFSFYKLVLVLNFINQFSLLGHRLGSRWEFSPHGVKSSVGQPLGAFPSMTRSSELGSGSLPQAAAALS